ncbi:MAG: META domain-containing protein [Methanotrichaceae archaeon]|nr:META domain-containing protein [Methanotrichaceae archaeon]
MKLRSFLGLALFILVIAVPIAGAEKATEKIWHIGPEMAPCTGVLSQMCLQIKENPKENYTQFSGEIEGFCYKPGFEYVIKVKEEPVSNPPADASNKKWTLIDVISKTGAATASNLERVSWSLDSYLSRAGKTECVLNYTEITALFELGRVSGNGGCNSYTGSYVADGNNLTISGVISTMMFCYDNISTQESEYLMNLGKIVTYNISGNLLRMMDSNRTVILTYSVTQPLPLVGTNWSMLNYNNGREALVGALTGTEVTALFNADGNLTGTAGCNNYKASYQVDGGILKIGPTATTRKQCAEPEGIMEQEKDYLAALESTASYRIDRQQLWLFFKNDSIAAIFENAAAL